MFDCDINHELTRRSAEKRRELNETATNIINEHHNQSITIDDLQDLVQDYATLNQRKISRIQAAERAMSTPKEATKNKDTSMLLDISNRESPVNIRNSLNIRQYIRKSVEGVSTNRTQMLGMMSDLTMYQNSMHAQAQDVIINQISKRKE